MTRKLFQENVYQKECESTILEITGSGTAEDPYLLVLDQTIFFPTGGGQPCDLGFVEGAALSEVFESENRIFHRLSSADCDAHDPQKQQWQTGTKVHCQLDWSRRFSHMQRHCGEHILSGIFFRETGGVNRGFHMGTDYMTIDIDVPGITQEQAQQIELLTNEVIWADVPVTVRYFEDREEAAKLPLRKTLAIDEDISIVCVGEESNPADCVACCGTHPSTSGQVGLVKLYKLENYKGMTRVYFDAGRGALQDYRQKHQILTTLNQKYSADTIDLTDKIKAQDEKSKEIRQELFLLKNTFIAKAAAEITGHSPAVHPLEITASGLIIREYPYFNANDLLSIARSLTESTGSIKSDKKQAAASAKPSSLPLIVMIATRENLVILASGGSPDCGKLVKDNAHIWNGKGGGNAAGSRAMFPSRDELECFVTFIRQAWQNS